MVIFGQLYGKTILGASRDTELQAETTLAVFSVEFSELVMLSSEYPLSMVKRRSSGTGHRSRSHLRRAAFGRRRFFEPGPGSLR